MKNIPACIELNAIMPFIQNCRVKITDKEGYIRHYRGCYYTDGSHYPLQSELINDTWVAEWSRRIQVNVEEIRYHVFGSPKYVTYP